MISPSPVPRLRLESPLTMPRVLQSNPHEPDKLVSYQVLVPRWMKNEAIALAKDQSKNLTDWTRDLLRAAFEAAGRRSRRRG
jgi:hypothetical protein